MIKCPYCKHEQRINHDDGYGYDEDTIYNQECTNCDKTFAYHTYITIRYETWKSECLNGGQHEWLAAKTYPKRYTKMVCSSCGDTREPSDEELKVILEENTNA